MTEKTSLLVEISRLREHMHFLYLRDNRISEDVLNASTLLDMHIIEYTKSTHKGSFV